MSTSGGVIGVIQMARRNPLLFRQDEYQFLHKVYLLGTSRSKVFVSIKDKKGISLDVDEIMHVKKKFEEWKLGNQNELLWMQ
jgi:hypothetical protein